VNKIYLGFQRFNIRVNYLACTNRRSASLLCCTDVHVHDTLERSLTHLARIRRSFDPGAEP
jgi:hypothetical protein